MPNFTGRRVYPLQSNLSPARDVGDVTTTPPRGIARGGTEPDYNDQLRGLFQRVDKKPKKPY